MVKQFKVILMSIMGLKEHIVNCNDETSARFICEGLYPKMRVIDVMENK